MVGYCPYFCKGFFMEQDDVFQIASNFPVHCINELAEILVMPNYEPFSPGEIYYIANSELRYSLIETLIENGYQLLVLNQPLEDLEGEIPVAFLLEAGIHIVLSSSESYLDVYPSVLTGGAQRNDQRLLKVQSDRGKFIVLYGSNNLGKSTQARRFACNVLKTGENASLGLAILKYPVYGLPSGRSINAWLRSGNKVESVDEVEEMQGRYAQNRRDFQGALMAMLNTGIDVVAEDYIGTALAWGMTMGVPFQSLLVQNINLIPPDLAILIDGQRFSASIEKTHRFERSGSHMWQRNRELHLWLAAVYNWTIINNHEPTSPWNVRAVDDIAEEIRRLAYQVILR